VKKLHEWSAAFGHQVRLISDRRVASNQFQEHIMRNGIQQKLQEKTDKFNVQTDA